MEPHVFGRNTLCEAVECLTRISWVDIQAFGIVSFEVKHLQNRTYTEAQNLRSNRKINVKTSEELNSHKFRNARLFHLNPLKSILSFMDRRHNIKNSASCKRIAFTCFYNSQNKQKTFPYTTPTNWYL